MDPVAVAQHSDTNIAMLMGVLLAVIKVGEKVLAWVADKFLDRFFKKEPKEGSNGLTGFVVRLDPEASRAISEILDRVERVHEILNIRDHDGVPLAYYPRSSGDRIREELQEVREGLHDLSLGLDRYAAKAR